MKTFLTGFFTACFLTSTALAQVATGKAAPDFTATDALSGKSFSLKNYIGKTVVLEWTNYDCPFVKKHYSVSNMQNLQKNALSNSIVWISINSGAEGKQGHFASDAAAKQAVANAKASPSLYVRDTDGAIGKAYGAQTTPHMFVVDAKGIVAYQGAIDDNASVDSADIATSKNYVAAAIAELAAGKAVTTATTRAYGCGVKY